MKPVKFSSTLLEVRQLTPTVKHLVFSTPSGFSFLPGQYISLILTAGDKKIRRLYSIASKPGGDTIELCIKIINGGVATPIIDKLVKGDTVEFLGPLGEFVIKDSSKERDLVFIATGTGVAPFRSMVLELLEKGHDKKITLIGGYRSYALYEELKELEKEYPQFNYKTLLSPQRVQGVLPEISIENTNFYICGLKEMVNSVREILVQRGVPMNAIHSEKYD